MNYEFQAIYEHGILRPLAPLALPEAAQVTVAVRDICVPVGGGSILTPDELSRQQEALNAMFARVDRLPQTPRNDGLSNRDHDQILYGSPK